jgi:hypothetical protein
MFRHLGANHPDLSQEKLDRLRGLMNRAVADVLVTGYESLIESVSLPDPDDRHVAAGAIMCKAQVIVTNNLKHVPADRPAECDLEPKTVYACVQQIVDSRKRDPATIDDVLAQLERSGLVDATAAFRNS